MVAVAFQLARRRPPPIDLMTCAVYLQAALHMKPLRAAERRPLFGPVRNTVDGNVSAIIDEEKGARGGGEDIRAIYQVALHTVLYVISEGANIGPGAASARHRRNGPPVPPPGQPASRSWWEVG